MKKKFKKGFTLVELVIVIAVIAVLAAVLIPTFAGVVNKSKKSAALQTATTTVTVMITAANGESIKGSYISTDSGKYWFSVGDNGALTAVTSATQILECWSVTSETLADLSKDVVVYSTVKVAKDETTTAKECTEGSLSKDLKFTPGTHVPVTPAA